MPDGAKFASPQLAESNQLVMIVLKSFKKTSVDDEVSMEINNSLLWIV